MNRLKMEGSHRPQRPNGLSAAKSQEKLNASPKAFSDDPVVRTPDDIAIVRLKHLITAAVKLWELKRGFRN